MYVSNLLGKETTAVYIINVGVVYEEQTIGG